MKKLLILITLLIALALWCGFLLLSPNSILSQRWGNQNQYANSGEVIASALNNSTLTDRALNNDDLRALTRWAESKLPDTRLGLQMSTFGLSASASYNVLGLGYYLNIHCLFSTQEHRLVGEDCRVGRVSLSIGKTSELLSWVVPWVFSESHSVTTALPKLLEGYSMNETLVYAKAATRAGKLDAITKRAAVSSDDSTLPYEDKMLLARHHLEFVGGYRIPRVKSGGRPFSSLYLDHLPGTNQWVTGHRNGRVIELFEPSSLGTGPQSQWPLLKEGRRAKALHDVRKITPSGVLWLDKDNVLVSGRKSYRSGFEPQWIAKVNIRTGQEQRFSVYAESGDENDNFHVMQALGGGFMRITDRAWAEKNLDGVPYLLGRGGYDVLGSPLGPALGIWQPGSDSPLFLLDFPDSNPARRDPYYTYPSIDSETYPKAQLPIWKLPDESGGYWQAGDVGGIAYIDHPQVKGVLVTHNFARGVLDYRAQGDKGSGAYFLVSDPEAFYSEQGGGNRGGHQQETGNQAYPNGLVARGAQVYDPADLTRVYRGQAKPYEAQSHRFDWPEGPLNWSDRDRQHSKLGTVLWDDYRQFLWLVFGNFKQTYLVAYRVNPDNRLPERNLAIPGEWLEQFQEAKKLERSIRKERLYNQSKRPTVQ